MNIEVITSIPRSLLFCLRTLPFIQAIHIPIIIGSKVSFKGKLYRGLIEIKSKQLKAGMIKLGIGGGSFNISGNASSFFQMSEKARLIFDGRCEFRKGFRMMINKNGIIEFGNHSTFNSNALISSNTFIKFGDYFCGGWNVTVIDWDGHDIKDCNTNEPINSPKPIIFGKGCWLSAYSTVMKGVHLADETIVPYGTILTKSCNQVCCIFGGSPNRILKENVYRSDRTKSRLML